MIRTTKVSSSRSNARVRFACIFAGILWLAGAASAQSVLYDFEIDSKLSGLDAAVEFTLATEGSLIGNYDEKTNPTGTRTKPGLLGPFGSTENVAVPAAFGFELAGEPQTNSAGSFRLEFDTEVETVLLHSFAIDYLGETPVSLPATLILDFDTFRTRNPDSLYIGAAIPLPFGELLLSSLTAVQVDGPAAGTLEYIGGSDYTFTVVPTVVITGAVDVFGNPVEIPPTPIPLPLMGTLTIGDAMSIITLSNPLEIAFDEAPLLVLPELPFDLPTILPPGGTAQLLLNLTLTQIGASIVGDLSLTAHGMQIVLGDCNGDLIVNFADFNAWSECFTGPGVSTPPGCGCGDTNESGQSDLRDFALVQNGFSS